MPALTSSMGTKPSILAQPSTSVNPAASGGSKPSASSKKTRLVIIVFLQSEVQLDTIGRGYGAADQSVVRCVCGRNVAAIRDSARHDFSGAGATGAVAASVFRGQSVRLGQVEDRHVALVPALLKGRAFEGDDRLLSFGRCVRFERRTFIGCAAQG